MNLLPRLMRPAFCAAATLYAVEASALPANDLLEACRAGLSDSGPLSYAAGLCTGTIATVFILGTRYGVCAPTGANVRQAMRIVIKYAEEHPSLLHKELATFSTDALHAAWPCRH